MATLQEKAQKLQEDVFAIRDALKDIDSNIEVDLKQEGILPEDGSIIDLATKDYVTAIEYLDQIKDRNCQFNFNEGHYFWKLADLIKRNGFKHVQNFAFMFCENPYVTSIPPFAIVTEDEQLVQYDFPTDLSKAYNISQMFNRCINLATINDELIISNAYDMMAMFQNCTGLTTWPEEYRLNLQYELVEKEDGTLETRTGKKLNNMFDGCVNLKDFPVKGSGSPIDANYTSMFRNCSSLTTIPNDFTPTFEEGYGEVSFNKMFQGCSSLSSIPMSWNLDCGKDFTSMFEGCSNLTSVILSCNNGTAFTSMFKNCTNLLNIELYCDKASKLFEKIDDDNRIVNGIFDGCSNLWHVTLKCSNISSLHSTFRAKHKLRSVEFSIKDDQKVSLESAFNGSFLIESISGINNIKITNCATAFQYNHQLKSLHLGDMSECIDCTNMFMMGVNESDGWFQVTDFSIANSENNVPEWYCTPDSEINFSQCYFYSAEILNNILTSIANAMLNYIKHSSEMKGNVSIKIPAIMYEQLISTTLATDETYSIFAISA